MTKTTITILRKMKQTGDKITSLTVYDASFTNILEAAGVEMLLVGDSLGNVIQGHPTTVPVTLPQMIYHTECVSRQKPNALIMTDLPFMSYATLDQALDSAKKLMQAGAEMVKLEGGVWLCDTVTRLTQHGIPVCCHLGLTPQSVHVLGGFNKQGKEPEAQQRMLEAARALEAAGASMVVLECIPTSLAQDITKSIDMPTIGIGAGPYCDGQVLVLYDMLGITSGPLPKFARNFLSETGDIKTAITAYINAVKHGDFPSL